MLRRRAGGGNHLCAQMAQQIATFVEHADRVMVAAQNQQAHAGLVQPRNQLVVEFARIAGRCAGVEHIAGNQHGVDLMGLYLLQQPVNQCLMLGLAALAHEVLAQMPVGGVEKTHAAMVCQPGRLAGRMGRPGGSYSLSSRSCDSACPNKAWPLAQPPPQIRSRASASASSCSPVRSLRACSAWYR